ncbi:MAG: nucleotide exchange factor GrpE [Candidatus Gracilibacteria bacterium]|nr:nucleotide exchange factor GrpE [Candidatus Gracilibacteria bacterium]
MTKKDDKNLEEEQKNIENEFDELNEEIKELEEIEEEAEKDLKAESEEISKLKELLARTQADYQNFKFRSERDRQDMMFFLKNDIFKKILPRVDDLERMIKNTHDNEKSGALYEAIISMEKALKKDLEGLGVKPFISIGEEINPDKHEVMTQIPSEKSGIIVDEFEKGYMLNDRVLRVAKVVVGS